MRYIVLEDEKISGERLKKLVADIRPDYRCVLMLDSVESAVISLPPLKVDLLFMDIQLADGLSFDIFDQVHIETPIIFTTAYDEYALQAFKANSVDYLLKPISPDELEIAINKFEKHRIKSEMKQAASPLNKVIQAMSPNGKERFVIKVGDHLRTVPSIDIQLVYSQNKGTYLFSKEEKRFLVDYTLDQTEELLSKKDFFRISRKFIVNVNYIEDMVSYSNSRLEVKIAGFADEQVIVARERVADFKSWLDR